MLSCKCGKQFKPWMLRPIKCSCGAVFNDGVEPVPVEPKSVEQLTTKQRRTAWLDLHEYAPKHAKYWIPEEARKFIKLWTARIYSSCNTCGSAWKKLDWQFNYESPETFFEDTVQAHNYVSTHHVKPPLPEISMDNAYAMFWNRAPQKKKQLVLSVATGPDYVKQLKVVELAHQEYADKCDADYLQLTNVTADWWGMEKFRVRNFVSQYDRVLFLDCDTIPLPDCADLFELVPATHVGAHNDMEALGPYTEWMKPEREDACKSQGVEALATDICFNSGVIVCSREHINLWNPPTIKLPTTHCAEQFWVEQNLLANNYSWFELPIEFNTQWWMKDYKRLKPQAQILHLANSPTKLKDLQEVMEQHFNYVNHIDHTTYRFHATAT